MDKLKRKFGDRLKLNEPLKNLTTLGIGGPAQAVLVVETEKELIEAICLAQAENIPYRVIGSGSNLLVSDEGFPGLIIKNSLRGLASQGDVLRAYSGTPLQELVNFTIEQGLGGMQKLTGIPGTVGGAVYGNAGAYGQTISDHLTEVVCFDREKKTTVTMSKEECRFSYRDSAFKQNNLIILEAHFQLLASQDLARSDSSETRRVLQGEAQETLKLRMVKYPPTLRCPGSFFKNVLIENLSSEILTLIPQDKMPYGKLNAGYLLENVGAKGQKVGNIQVSTTHANLFINLGEGKASDFYRLAKTYAEKVKAKYGIILEPEVQFINLPPLS